MDGVRRFRSLTLVASVTGTTEGGRQRHQLAGKGKEDGPSLHLLVKRHRLPVVAENLGIVTSQKVMRIRH